MILSDKLIRETQRDFNILEPFSEGVKGGGVISLGLTHAGYDLRLGYTAKVFKNTWNEVVDPKRFHEEGYESKLFDVITVKEGDCLYVPPSPGYILAYSLEYIRMPRHLKGRCVGKSTWARCGLIVNTTPLEPMWQGHLTIEIANVGPCPVRLYPGEGICQLELEMLAGPPQQDYAQAGGKYQNQGPEPVAARMILGSREVERR